MDTIIITGIGGQIGSALDRQLSSDWNIVGFDIQPTSYDKLNALDEPAVVEFFQEHADAVAVINCLGNSDTADFLSFATVLDVSKDSFSSMLNSNLVSLFIVMREYLRSFTGTRGNVVNLASLYSTVSPNPNIYDDSVKHPGYIASKFGLVGLTRYMAVMAAKRNINMNCVSPGAVLGTKGVEGDFLDNYIKLTPSKDGVTINEVYKVVKMLCRNDSITGQNIVIDGGYGLW